VEVPPGFAQLFPYAFASDALASLGLLADGLGGEVLNTHESAAGTLANAHVRFGDTTIMVSEATPANPATNGTYYLYVADADADAATAQDIAAGGTQPNPSPTNGMVTGRLTSRIRGGTSGGCRNG
jgi:PhnB protein